MNIKTMNGKLIFKILWPGESAQCLEANENIGLHMSATHHGDHDEFWIVESDAEGREIRRHNIRYVDMLEWVEPIEASK